MNKLFFIILLVLMGNSFSSNTGYIHGTHFPADHTIKVCWMTDGHDQFKQQVETQINATWAYYGDINLNTNWPPCYVNNVMQEDGIKVHLNTNASPDSDGHISSTTGGFGCISDLNEYNWIVCREPFEQTSPVEIIFNTAESNFLNFDMMIVVHEYGHAFGLGHEHFREQTDSACFDQITTARPSENKIPINMYNVGLYDNYSVMHYECNAATPATGGEISCGDIATIRELYGNKNIDKAPNCLVEKLDPTSSDFLNINGPPDWYKLTYAKSGIDTDTDDCTVCIDEDDNTYDGTEEDTYWDVVNNFAVGACAAFGGAAFIESGANDPRCGDPSVPETEDIDCTSITESGIFGLIGCGIGFAGVYVVGGIIYFIKGDGIVDTYRVVKNGTNYLIEMAGLNGTSGAEPIIGFGLNPSILAGGFQSLAMSVFTSNSKVVTPVTPMMTPSYFLLLGN